MDNLIRPRPPSSTGTRTEHVAEHDQHLQDEHQTAGVVVHNQRHPQVLQYHRLVDDHNCQHGDVVLHRDVVQ